MKKEKRNNLFMILWYSHPRIATLLALIVVNIAIIFLFTGILCVISKNPFLNELAYIFTYTMCSDGIYDFVNSQEDLLCFIIKIVLTVLQMIIFSGALIGFSTDFIQNIIDKNLNNLGKINLNSHYIFLNWSSIGPQMIYDLSFLEGKKNIVILSNYEREEVLNSIQNIFLENKKKIKNIRLFIKQGDSNSIKHLHDVSISKAKYVGILLSKIDYEESEKISEGDLESLKLLLNIVNISSNANIVVETSENDSVVQIDKLINSIDPKLNSRVMAFSHNSVLGHILGKTVVNSSFSELYHYLLSFDGSEFYGIEPMDMSEALYSFNDCIPIINYDDDGIVDENGKRKPEQLYIFSDTKDTLGVRDTKLRIERRLNYEAKKVVCDFTLFIFSNSKNYSVVVDEINRYNIHYGTNIKVVYHRYDDDFNNITKEINEINGEKKILLLSDVCEFNESQDTNIFLSALNLKLGGCLKEGVEVLAEITNPSNYNALKNIGIMSVIMSNRIISLFMVQLMTHPGSNRFYRDLISTNADENDAVDIEIIKVKDILNFEGNELEFKSKSELVQSFYFSSNCKKMCIGYKKCNDEILFLAEDMDKKENIILNKNDELILISY